MCMYIERINSQVDKESGAPQMEKRTDFCLFVCLLCFVLVNAAAAKSLQSCPTLCSPIDGSPPGSSVPGILQARILEWAAISFSNACMHAKSLQLCPLCVTPWTAAHQAPLSMGFSRQEYWSGLPFPSPSFDQMDLCRQSNVSAF